MIVFLLVIVFVVGIASASFVFQGEDVVRSYSGGGNIIGNIKISLYQEPSNSQLTSTYSGNISILDLIRKNGLVEGSDYSCNIRGCNEIYVGQSGSISSLDLQNSKIIGFNVSGREVSIQDADFKISGTSSVSCTRPLIIDVLGLGENYIQNNQYDITATCGEEKNYGCFNGGLSDSSYSSLQVTTFGICEKVHLTYAPAYYAGAKIKNASMVYSTLSMELLDNETGFIGGCTLPILQQNIQEVSCIINKSIDVVGDYYVCIKSDASESDYQIKGESSGSICGMADPFGSQSRDFDYEIFTKPIPYGPINKMSIKQAFESKSSDSFVGYIDDYIENRYGRNCTGGCIIPFAIEGISQTLSFSNISIVYEATPGNIVRANSLYPVTKSSSLIDARNITLELSHAKFTIPLTTSQKSFNLYLRGSKMMNNDIPLDITPGFNFSVSPKFAYIGLSTTFIASTSQNITGSTWKFGDGTQTVSQGISVTHTYASAGNYTLEVTLVSSNGYTANKVFTIIVGNPKESALQLLNLSDARLANVENQINTYPEWIREGLKNSLNISRMRIEVSELRNLSKNGTDTTYIEVIEGLTALSIPSSIVEARKGVLPFSIGLEGLDVSYIEKISKYNVSRDKKQELKDNIIYWVQKKYSSNVDFQVISSVDGAGNKRHILTSYSISLTPQMSDLPETYFIIDYPLNSINFKEAYGQKNIEDEILSGAYFPLKTDKISFYVDGEQNLEDLGMYISPIISEVGTYEEEIIVPTPLPFVWLVFWIVLSLIAVFVIYIILQEWYKKNYENYLFKNQDDLYNVITFIFNTRNSGLDDGSTRKKLAGTGWNHEQLAYAFNKLDGKRTGMYEIPIFRFREQKKVKREIAIRQEKGGDARFIKTPRF